MNFQEQKKTYKLRGGVVIELVQGDKGDVALQFVHDASSALGIDIEADRWIIAALGFPTEHTEAVEDCGEAEEL